MPPNFFHRTGSADDESLFAVILFEDCTDCLVNQKDSACARSLFVSALLCVCVTSAARLALKYRFVVFVAHSSTQKSSHVAATPLNAVSDWSRVGLF